MNTLELKSELHRMVVETNDSGILEQVKSYFSGLTSEENGMQTISDKERELIEKGMEDIEAGRVVPHAEVQKQIRQLIESHQK